MTQNVRRILVGSFALAMAAFLAAPVCAQTPEGKEKPPMYTYVGNWNIPRAQWGEMEKSNASNQKILEKALASGGLVGFGDDTNLIHSADGATHDQWWSATSMAGVVNVLEQFYQNGSATSPVLASATKHWDGLYVSRYYNWHAGSWKGVYTRGAVYKLKTDAPDDAVEKLSKNLVVPFLEKMLAEGSIHEYEIDTEAVHTEAPGTFVIVYIAANTEALDKVSAALRETMKANPLGGPAFESMVESTGHRDELLRSNATYK